jgi:hypothetical protein
MVIETICVVKVRLLSGGVKADHVPARPSI